MYWHVWRDAAAPARRTVNCVIGGCGVAGVATISGIICYFCELISCRRVTKVDWMLSILSWILSILSE